MFEVYYNEFGDFYFSPLNLFAYKYDFFRYNQKGR